MKQPGSCKTRKIPMFFLTTKTIQLSIFLTMHQSLTSRASFQAFSVNAFQTHARTTWLKTHDPRRIMRPREQATYPVYRPRPLPSGKIVEGTPVGLTPDTSNPRANSNRSRFPLDFLIHTFTVVFFSIFVCGLLQSFVVNLCNFPLDPRQLELPRSIGNS